MKDMFAWFVAKRVTVFPLGLVVVRWISSPFDDAVVLAAVVVVGSSLGA